jgi:phosphoglycerate dehydrogenase-like enzyme
MTHTITFLDQQTPRSAARLEALLPGGFAITSATSGDADHLMELIAKAGFAVTGHVPVGREMLAKASHLKLLHKWGVGTDNIDIAAAREFGITVARTTGSNAIPVAEFTLGLMLAALRNIAYGHAELKQGIWRGGGQTRDAFMLSGKCVGLVGFGAIGKAVARLLAGFGCRILYTKTNRLAVEEEEALGVEFAALPELLAEADIVSLHCPLTAATAGLINDVAFARMKPTAVLVNVARGGVVVEPDLVAALRNGTIHAAAMDVFEVEPLPPGSALLTLDNLVVTPHLAALAADNFARTVNQMFGNIARVASGGEVTPADLVTGP